MKKQIALTGLLFISLISFAQLPSYFDLRQQGFVTSVKSQQGGTCWTHGTMAAIESNLAKTQTWTLNNEIGEPNLAEYHLDWWNGFNKHYNEDLTPSSGNGLDVHQGGDYLVATAYLSRLEGAVRDIDGQSFNTPPDRYNVNYHYYYPRTVEWMVMGNNLEGIEVIKQSIMENGAMATCMCYSNSFIDYNYNHYQPNTSLELPNHSVTIVGWDDSRVVPAAPYPGAWIVKNSWGVDWGESGYFWISYYDKWSCREPEMGAVSFKNVEFLQYNDVYYHDYHGWRDTKTDIEQVYNSFIAKNNHKLSAVSFFVASDSVYYKVKIYGKKQADTLASALSMTHGTINKKGFHTIDLDMPVQLKQDEAFYIYLYLSRGGQPYDRTSIVPVLLNDTLLNKSREKTVVQSSASENESFYFQDNKWNDFYFYNDPSNYQHTGNFCVKGLTKEVVSNTHSALFRILKQSSHLGIPGAMVTIGNETQIADNQGDTQFSNIDTLLQNYNLSVRADGYYDFDTIINNLNNILIADIYLSPINISAKQEESSIKLYPNPADKYIILEGVEGDFNYTIYNADGKVVKTGKNETHINVASLNKGTYYIETINKKQAKHHLKFIK